MSITTLCSAINSLDAAAQGQWNSTSPWTVVSPGWAPEPNGRGTMGIVWSCLVTIFACSWTVTHPIVPRKGEWHTLKVWLCVTAVIAPEWMAFVAYQEFLRVRHHLKAIEKTTKSQWAMSQMFFVSMGGVELEFNDCTETLGCNSHGVFDSDDAVDIFQRAVQLKVLDVKFISAEDVRIRAKTNHLIKALICLQASWLVTQVIGRAVERLPITTLEVVTVGYVVCALIHYACLWYKPQDAEVRININCRSFTRAQFKQQITTLPHCSFRLVWYEIAFTCAIGCSFGAVHCTAWNFFFATFAESMTWRVASLLTMVIPPLFTLCLLNYGIPDWREGLASPLLFLYIPVRLYLMVEPFVAFRSVPVGIFYTVNWSNWIPHV
jgi:hypothetical protein